MCERASWTDQFPGNFQWSNAMLVCKGMAPYGAVSIGEIDRIAARLERATEASPAEWLAAWTEFGHRNVDRARAADAEGRRETAGLHYLRAGNYLYAGERFVPPGEEKREIGRLAFECFHEGLRRRHPDIEFVSVPYEGGALPALFMPAAGKPAGAPTIVVVNGMDNCKEMSILFAGLEFSACGFNTLSLDGPGQGETLRMLGIHARHDYEVPAAAAFEMLAQRGDVDPARTAIMGYSFGGYYAARIAAKEPRFAAGVALTAGHWDLHAFQSAVRERALREQRSVAQSTFQFQWVVGARDADEALEAARRFSVRDIASEIMMPFLVTHGAEDRIIPVENAAKLHEAMPSPRKALRVFSRDEGGCEHAHVDDRQVGVAFAADWLGGMLGRARR